MHLIWILLTAIVAVIALFYMAGVALFIFGLGMFIETGNYLFLIALVLGLYLMVRSN